MSFDPTKVPAHRDRRDISRLLLPHFLEMDKATSDEWHAFLNEKTGLAVDPMESNGIAFDEWRKALAQAGYPVWPYTPAAVTHMQARGAQLKAEVDAGEARRKTELPALMADRDQFRPAK